MVRSNAAYFGIGAVAGSAVTALFFLFKEGMLFVGDNAALVTLVNDAETQEKDDSEEKPVQFKETQLDYNSENIAYHSILQNAGYAKEDDGASDEIVEIAEEDYFDGGRDGSYDMQALTLYSNGVLADSSSDRILDARDQMSVLGELIRIEELLKKFENGVDIFYVRNKRLYTQYEISYDDRTYEEVTGQVAYG